MKKEARQYIRKIEDEDLRDDIRDCINALEKALKADEKLNQPTSDLDAYEKLVEAYERAVDKLTEILPFLSERQIVNIKGIYPEADFLL